MPYDPREFIVPAEDSKGHSSRAWFRLQSGHDRQLDIVLKSRRFGYRTKGDIIRHAVVRHLRWLDSLEAIPSVTAQVDAVQEVLRDHLFQQEFVGTFNMIGNVVNMHLSLGAPDEAAKLVASLKAHLELMPDGFWKEKYLAEIDSRYGRLLEGKGVKLK